MIKLEIPRVKGSSYKQPERKLTSKKQTKKHRLQTFQKQKRKADML